MSYDTTLAIEIQNSQKTWRVRGCARAIAHHSRPGLYMLSESLFCKVNSTPPHTGELEQKVNFAFLY